MDGLDQKLLGALRRDGRATLSELAAILGVARATIRARLTRLVAAGEVIGFTVQTRGDVSRSPVRGLMMLAINGHGTGRIRSRLLAISSVKEVHSTNGRWDLIVEIGTDTLEEFDDVLAVIRRFDGVTTSETNLLLRSSRPGRVL